MFKIHKQMRTICNFFDKFIQKVEGFRRTLDVLVADAVEGLGEVDQKHYSWHVVVVAVIEYVIHAKCYLSNEPSRKIGFLPSCDYSLRYGLHPSC